MLAISASVVVLGAHQVDRIAGGAHQDEDQDRHPEQRHDRLQESDDELATHNSDYAAVCWMPAYASQVLR